MARTCCSSTVSVADSGSSFVGSYVLGMGFVLAPEEREALVTKNRRNAERIFPYLGGEEVNTSPTQSFDRYVINFGEMSLEKAEEWPDLLSIVREKVKPERDQNNREIRKKYWWRFGETTPALYAALADRKRCLVTGIVTKHLMFSFQPTGRVFSHKLFVFPFETNSTFAVLQSRLHGAWTWLLSSTMKTDLNYSASDCFETFPFPQSDPRTKISALEDIGHRLYDARTAYMAETQQGLTQTYNKLKDPDCQDPDILHLRELHLEMDRAVLTAYGWADLADKVPPFTTPQTQADKVALAAFEDVVIDRLFALNAERASAEGLAGKGTTAPRAPSAPRKASSGKPTKSRASNQLDLKVK